jgi:aryl-alcohol dehydrogenase-like predicted oxidoreductase
MNFAARTPDNESFEILDRATESGINFIDTANQYGGARGVGATEELLGQWLKTNPGRRDKLVMATKVHEPMSEDVNDRGLSARHIQLACEQSLKRLGVDHIDLYQMHHIDRAAHPDEIWMAMERLIHQGKITYVGSSNFPGWAIARLSERASARQQMGLVSEQSLYNLVERRIELEVLPACRTYGLGLIPWSPLAGGLLAGQGEEGGRRSSDAIKTSQDRYASQISQFNDLCKDLEEPPSAVALAWLLHQPGVSSTIIGPRTLDQLTSVLHVSEVLLDNSTLKAIEQIFPPYGEAPKAYAW